MFEHRVEVRTIMGACRDFAGDRLKFGRCYRELAENSPEVCWEVFSRFHRQVVRSSSGVRRKNARSLSRVHRKKLGAREGFIGRMSGVRRKFPERSVDGQTMKIVF
ncbi:hypothetical protein BHM03_00025526 [Ensete ventricosum]|nr:hypothetical protein BHM03_00025526 [Ensete ventricosum]